MSFDLAVWKSTRPLIVEEAQRLYEKLCEDEIPSEIKPCPEMRAFFAELMTRWPHDDPEADDCPFEDPRDSDVFQILCIAWSRVKEVAPEVIAIALKHGLICHDPQNGEVHQPESKKRPW